MVLPNEPWPDLVKRWTRLDAAGLDSVWCCDHFTNPHVPGQSWFEGWASLAALATLTKQAHIGLLVGAITSRPPTLLAKHAQVVDHITQGRLTIGLGAGGAPTDQAMWGLENWTAGERLGRFAEYVELLDVLLRTDGATFEGKWYSTTGARMTPGFVQQPRPPLLLAAHAPRSLEIAARFADVWNVYGPTLAEAVAASRRLDELCRDAGREPATVTRSVLLGIRPETAWGDAKKFEELVHAWHAEGFREFFFYDPPVAGRGMPVAPAESVEELLAETIPRLRQDLS